MKPRAGADRIEVRGAFEHNLQSVDVTFPKNALVVFSGVSGSGKSSLAFDTLFAEGQRRYVESLSAYARQFLGQMERPHYESIRGLCPTIAIEQKSASSNPRSTVGTITEIYDHLRVLFARTGEQHCTGCDRPVRRQDVPQIVRAIEELPEGTRILLLAPIVRARKGQFADVFRDAAREGFARARVDGKVYDLSAPPRLTKTHKHDIDLVVDRLVAGPGRRERLTDSVETALRHGDGRLVLAVAGRDDLLFSERYACDYCRLSFPEPTPQLFSFNSPLGMCPECNGLGSALQVDEERLVPDPDLSLDTGLADNWPGTDTERGLIFKVLRGVAAAHGIDPAQPWSELAPESRAVLLYGSNRPVTVEFDRLSRGRGSYRTHFEGVARRVLRLYRETRSESQRRYYGEFLSTAPCEACGGTRLRPEARAIRVLGRTLPQLVELPVRALEEFVGEARFEGRHEAVAHDLIREIRSRLRFLRNVGLGYLTLGRSGASLSGGESQRIRLASQIGSELTGVLYILDEPSIGLHARDGARLIAALEALRDLGNTVLVVEHDEATLRAADHIVDFGPGAGRAGGKILFSGPPSELMAVERSLTGGYLSGRLTLPIPTERRAPSGWLTVRGARANNLKGIDVAFPLGVFAVVCGVSGAGKSTLVNDILYPALARKLQHAMIEVGAHSRVEGAEALDKVIRIDQKPIGRTPRSNPATYTKVFDHIRQVFSRTREARMFGYGPGRFSFNVKGGRCERCRGAGSLRVEMHFLPDVFVTCPECGGRRFNEATLKVRYRGLDIAEVLALTVDEALSTFEHHRNIRRILETLRAVGLGYLPLGQPSPTLSGGEAQRIKLSRELARVNTGRTLYVLDEPSTGLHMDDVLKLLAVVDELVEQGNSVVMIEHHLGIVRTADYIIDLGPEGGEAGGMVVAVGTPEEVAESDHSPTGEYLRSLTLRHPTS